MWQYNHAQQNELRHYGVKGMKWGRRRAVKKQTKALQKSQKKYDEDVKTNWYKAYNKAAERSNAFLIPALNKKYKGVNFNDPKNSSIRDKYEKEYADKFNTMYKQELKTLFGDRPA